MCLCSTHPTMIFMETQETKPAGVLALFGKARPTVSAAEGTFRAVRNFMHNTRLRTVSSSLDRPFLLVDQGPRKVPLAWLAQLHGPFGFGGHHQDRAWGDNQ